MKALQIFKPGKHVASDGRAFTFTEADVKATAAAYDTALHEAPLVVGHPTHNAPAYGWVKSIAFADGALQVTPDQVNPEFAELVKSGAFKKVSASFYAPDAPENPKPGAYYLRHVGFLGATAPAVKGLKSAEFGENEAGVIEFMDWTTRDIATMFRSIRDWMIGKYGKDEADKVIPDWTVQSVSDSAIKNDETTGAITGVSYSENPDVKTKEQEELERRERELKAKEEAQQRQAVEFAEREKKVKESETAQRRVVIVGEIDALVLAGKLLPKDKAGMVAFMETLDVAGVVEFGEGDKKEKKPTREWFSAFLKNLPKAVDFTERGARGENADLSSDPLVQAAELSKRALEFQEIEKKAGRTVDIASAVAHVKAQASA